MPFVVNDSERPHINYRHIPVHALHELTRMVDDLLTRLPNVDCPVHLLQADQDPVVDPESVHLIAARLEQAKPEVQWVESTRHGIVPEDIDRTQDRIVSQTLEFLDRPGPVEQPATPVAASS